MVEIFGDNFREVIEGCNKILAQVELEYRINNNWEFMDGLGHIEEKINQLKAAQVNIQIFSET